MTTEGRGFVTANKAIANSDEAFYGEISVYVRVPEGFNVDEDKLEARLKETITAAFEEAVDGTLSPNAQPASNEALNRAAAVLELPADVAPETA